MALNPAFCGYCGLAFTATKPRKYCSVTCSNRSTNSRRATGRDPEKVRANSRAKNHRRRCSLAFVGDVTPAYERELRRKARACPICSAGLTDTPLLPHSKELDHIIPVNVGGTHTIGNVRIICRACNGKRPHDGSDYVGPVTLWAQDYTVAPNRPKPGFCGCGTQKVRSRCYRCRPRQEPKRRQSDGQRAAQLRAEGWSWGEIARELRISYGHNAGKLARKYGARELIDQWPSETGCRDCGAQLLRGGRGRPRAYCTECRPIVSTVRKLADQRK